MWSCSICQPCFFFICSSFERICKTNSSYIRSPSETLKSIGTIDTKCTIKHSFIFHIVPWEGIYANHNHRQNISWWHHDLTENFPTLKKKKNVSSIIPSPTSDSRHFQLLFLEKGDCMCKHHPVFAGLILQHSFRVLQSLPHVMVEVGAFCSITPFRLRFSRSY